MTLNNNQSLTSNSCALPSARFCLLCPLWYHFQPISTSYSKIFCAFLTVPHDKVYWCPFDVHVFVAHILIGCSHHCLHQLSSCTHENHNPWLTKIFVDWKSKKGHHYKTGFNMGSYRKKCFFLNLLGVLWNH